MRESREKIKEKRVIMKNEEKKRGTVKEAWRKEKKD